MGCGVLEPKEPVVQGTIQLFDDSQSEEEHPVTTEHLKHTKDGKILLNPQPSDDPEDPLNWPLWRRDFSFLILVMAVVLSGTHGPILSPVTISLAMQYHVSITAINQLSSYMTLAIAIFAYFGSVTVRIYGTRGVTVIACLVLVVADGWAAGAKSYGSLMGARVLSGVGQAIFEALVLATIPDLYFVHERGTRIAGFIYGLQAGVYLGVPIATQIVESSGLKWTFGGLAIAEGIVLLLLIFFFRETSFRRDHLDVLAHKDRQAVHETQQEEAKHEVRQTDQVQEGHLDTAPQDTRPPTTWSRLSLYQGRFSDRSPFALMLRVLILNFHPTILWTAVAALPATWLVGLSFTVNALLAAPPWNMSSVGIANMYIAGWLGATAGMILSIPNDWMAKRVTKWNKNIYEPEFRLVFMIPALIFIVLALTGWGWGGQVGTNWVGMAFFYAIACAGAVLINSALISFIIDAHREFAVESQVILFAFKNFLPFGMGYFWVPWWLKDGNRAIWATMAGVSAAVALLGIGFYVYGKRLRAFWMRHPFPCT